MTTSFEGLFSLPSRLPHNRRSLHVKVPLQRKADVRRLLVSAVACDLFIILAANSKLLMRLDRYKNKLAHKKLGVVVVYTRPSPPLVQA